MAKLSAQKKRQILKTVRAGNLGEGLEKGTGERKDFFRAFKKRGAEGVLNRLNKQYRQDNPFGELEGKLNKKGKLTLKGIRKGRSIPEKLAVQLGKDEELTPTPDFDEAGAKEAQQEMKDYFAARSAEGEVGYTRGEEDLGTEETQFGEDVATQQSALERGKTRFGEELGTERTRFGEGLSTERSRFGEGIGTERSRLTAAQAESERFRAIQEGDENLNKNAELAGRNISGSPAAERLKARLQELQSARLAATTRGFTEQGEDISTRERYGTEDFGTRERYGSENFATRERYGNEDFGTQQTALDTARTRGVANMATRRSRLGQDRTLYQQERERQLQELLGSDLEARREKFYNQQSLPSSAINYGSSHGVAY